MEKLNFSSEGYKDRLDGVSAENAARFRVEKILEDTYDKARFAAETLLEMSDDKLSPETIEMFRKKLRDINPHEKIDLIMKKESEEYTREWYAQAYAARDISNAVQETIREINDNNKEDSTAMWGLGLSIAMVIKET